MTLYLELSIILNLCYHFSELKQLKKKKKKNKTQCPLIITLICKIISPNTDTEKKWLDFDYPTDNSPARYQGKSHLIMALQYSYFLMFLFEKNSISLFFKFLKCGLVNY